MSTQQRTTVVGVFNDHREADKAVAELLQAGFPNDQIGVAGRHDETALASTADEQGSHAASGALTGALAGVGLGGLVGLGVLAGVIPVLGPIIAGGTLATILANAAGGLALGGLAGALAGSGVPEEEAKYYHGEFEAGRTIVTVKADGRYDEASAILRRHGAYDMHTAGGTARSATPTPSAGATTRTASATTGHTTTGHTAPAAAAAASTHRATGDKTIEVKEERLSAQTRPVDAGEVTVRKDVVTEHKTIDVPVQREEVVIERHTPTGRNASTSDTIREGEEIRIPVREEKVTVNKETVVTEEVNVGKRVVKDTERVSGDVRKEQVRVEREGHVDVRTNETDKGKPAK